MESWEGTAADLRRGPGTPGTGSGWLWSPCCHWGLCGLWSTAPYSPPRRRGCLLKCHRARWQWGGDPPCYDGWSWDTDSLLVRPPDLSPQARGPCQGVPQLQPCLLLTGLGGGEEGRARARALLSRRASWEGQSRDSPGVGASRLASLGPFPATLFPPKLSIRPRKPTTVPKMGPKVQKAKEVLAASVYSPCLFGQGLHLEPFLRPEVPRAPGLSFCTPSLR